MDEKWNYMVDFLCGKTKPLDQSDADTAYSHCLYVEAFMLPEESIITRQPVHKAVPLPRC